MADSEEESKMAAAARHVAAKRAASDNTAASIGDPVYARPLPAEAASIAEPEDARPAEDTQHPMDAAPLTEEEQLLRATAAALGIPPSHLQVSDIREMVLALMPTPAKPSATALDETRARLREQLRIRKSGPAQEAHSARAIDRDSRMTQLLDQGQDTRLNLSGSDTAAITGFLSKPVSDHSSLTHAHGPLALLMRQNIDSGGSPAMAWELVRDALARQHETKRATNWEQLCRRISRARELAIEEDPVLAGQLQRHLELLMQLTLDYDFEIAEQYHHSVMLRIEDDRFDMASGPDVYSLLRVTTAPFGKRSNSGSGGSGRPGRSNKNGKGSYNKDKALFCDHHGYCSHDTSACKGNFAKGEKSKNYRAER